jgi:diguanylate cyclase (GGDEF)-like protein
MLKRFHQLPIGKKLQAINMLMISLITLLTIISLCFYMISTLQNEYQGDSKNLSNLLAENVNSALLFGDKKSAQEALTGLRTVDNVSHAEIYDKAGNLFASYAKGTSTISVPAHFDSKGYETHIRIGKLTFNSAHPVLSVTPDKEQIGTLTMQLDLSNAYAHLGYQIIGLLVIGLIGAGLASVALSKLQNIITLPLKSLTEAMSQISQTGNFSAQAIATGQRAAVLARGGTPGRDEIGELSRVFNHMMGELSQRENSLQQELKERRRIEDKLAQIAHFDTITNLPNRHSFNIQIDRALVNFKYDLEKFALLYIDLDNFKYVNDTFGHHVGDLLLACIGERMVKTLRKEDFVARLGGDEFVVIISAFDETTQIGVVAETILGALQTPFSLEGHEAFVGASIGIAICPDNGKDSETLQRQADSAMYRAKNLGKNNFQFYIDELSRTQKNRISIEAQLHRALERNEIVVYYQPILEITSKKIVGFEALVRWIKQDGTIVRPDEFITLAEEIGLIVDIGRYVLNTAATQTLTWVDRFGLAFTAVNFSSRQFKHNDLAADIFNALKNSQLQPGNFEMEITESVLMDNTIDSKNFLGMLIKKGMGIAIDDFGTGYSSLSYLTSFPISKLKIDKSFVAKLPNDKNALAVVTAIIGLAKSLNLKVVAEGIETIEQLECLTKLECQYGQGYLFSKPVPVVEATKLLEMYGSKSMLFGKTV